jgi:hypothetical protein
MKMSWIVMVACVACSCCRKSEDRNVTVWLVPTTNGVRAEIAHMPVSADWLNSILRQLSAKHKDLGLVICLSRGVSVSNSMQILNLAEAYGITNSVVRLNQIRPPYVPPKADHGIVEPWD